MARSIRMAFPLYLVIAFAMTASCAREVFPDEDQIVGHWIERDATKASDALYQLDITATTFTTISPDSIVNAYSYILERDSRSIVLTDPSGGGTAALELEYDRKDDLLGIFGFYVSTPEDRQWTHFERND